MSRMRFVKRTEPKTLFSGVRDWFTTKFCQGKLIKEFDYYMAFHVEDKEKFNKEHPLLYLINGEWKKSEGEDKTTFLG